MLVVLPNKDQQILVFFLFVCLFVDGEKVMGQ